MYSTYINILIKTDVFHDIPDIVGTVGYFINYNVVMSPSQSTFNAFFICPFNNYPLYMVTISIMGFSPCGNRNVMAFGQKVLYCVFSKKTGAA